MNNDSWVSGDANANSETKSAPEQENNQPQVVEQNNNQANVPTPDAAYPNAGKVTTLCIVSLVCHYLPIIGGAIMAVFSVVLETFKIDAATPIGILTFPAYIASWILMAVARSYDKRRAFPKVLMWIYIIEILLIIVLAVIGIMLFISVLSSCRSLE